MNPIDPDFGAYITDITDKDLGVSNASLPSWCKDHSTRYRFRYCVGKRIVQQAKSSMLSRAERDREIAAALDPLSMIPPGWASSVGSSGSDVCDTLTYEHLDTVHSFFTTVICGQHPYVMMDLISTPDEGAISEAREAVQKKQGFFNQWLESIGWRGIVDEAGYNTLSQGIAFLCPVWRRTVSNVRQMSRMDVNTAQGFGFSRVMIPGIDGAQVPTDPPVYSKSMPGGRKRTVKQGEVFSIDQETIIEDTPGVNVPSYFDCVLYPSRPKKLSDVWLFGHRSVVPLGDVVNDARSGIYDEKAVNDLMDDKVFNPLRPGQTTNLVESEPLPDTETISADTEDMGFLSKQVELLHCFCRVDGDGDGDAEVWSITVETGSGIILRANRDDSHPCGMPVVAVTAFRDYAWVYGVPMTTLLSSLQEMADASINLAFDAGMIANTKILAQRRAALNKIDSDDLRVGINTVDVDEPGDAFELQDFGGGASQNFPTNEFISQKAQRMTAASDNIIGVTGKGDNTATESQNATSSGRQRLLVKTARVVEGLQECAELLEYMLTTYFFRQAQGNMEAQLMSPIVKGSQYAIGMTLEEWMHPCKISINGDPSVSDPQLKLQAAEKLALWAERSPFIMGNARRQYAVARFFLSAYGRSQDYPEFIGTAEEAIQMEEDAKKVAGPKPPSVPPNINVQALAVYLAENPDQAGAVQKELALITDALGKGEKDDAPEPSLPARVMPTEPPIVPSRDLVPGGMEGGVL